MPTSLRQLGERWTRKRFDWQTKKVLSKLYRVARRLTEQQADAEDLVHDTFIKAFQAYPSANLRSAKDFRAWLFKIMVNTYRDLYRRRLRSCEVGPVPHTGDGAEWDFIELAQSLEPSPQVRLEYKRFAEAAQVVIGELPPEVRLVVTLFFVEGMTYQEIAQVADCPIGTVMSRLWRGRQVLRRRLQSFVAPLSETRNRNGGAATIKR